MATDNINQSEIAERAYSYFTARGCEHGHDQEDWTRAETELRRERNSRAPVTAPRSGTAAKAVRSSTPRSKAK